MTAPCRADTRPLVTAARTDLHILRRFPGEESAQLRPLVVLNVQECGGELEIVQCGGGGGGGVEMLVASSRLLHFRQVLNEARKITIVNKSESLLLRKTCVTSTLPSLRGPLGQDTAALLCLGLIRATLSAYLPCCQKTNPTIVCMLSQQFALFVCSHLRTAKVLHSHSGTFHGFF